MDKIVAHIDHQTFLRTAENRTTHSSTDHLIIENATCRRPGDNYCSHLRSVEPSRQNSIVTKHLHFPMPKQINQIPTRGFPSFCRDRSCLPPTATEQDSHRLRMLNRASEEQHWPRLVQRQYCF